MTELDKGLADAIRDPECPVQFSPLLMEAKFTLRKQADEIERLCSVMQQTEDAMNSACLRDGGSYWLPAAGHQVEVWSGNLHTALESADDQQTGSKTDG